MTMRSPSPGPPTGRATFLRIGAVAVALGLLAALLWAYFARGFIPGDALTYLAGAGLQAHLTYLSIARQTTDGGATPESLSTVAQVLGVPAAIAATAPVAFFIACAGVMFALRDRPGVTYAIAVLASVFGSPVVNNENLVRLLPILLPLGDSKPTEKGIV